MGGLWCSVSALSRREAVNPVRPGREQRQQWIRVPGCGWCGMPPNNYVLQLANTMSYKVLARKWRPQHFRDMLGQEPVLRALGNALDTDRLHHAYLFTGMRGVGKTTIARILAKCLNCETNGVSSTPCGECSTCVDIEAGRFFDLIEVDAASRTKVDETRELLENVPYAPASGRYKVYLIDEVHMFSTHSFNALLKTLEEPPSHVKFVLATTDPQKVPVTVLSRCLQFNLKRIAPGKLADYLQHILDTESISNERPALELIARASEGSVRDSLSLVEQAAAFGEGAVRAVEVESMLGRVSTARLLELLTLLDAGDLPALFAMVDALAEYGPDFGELLGELLSLLHRVAMLQSVPGSVDEATPGYEQLQALSQSMAGDVVQLNYQIGMHARRDMPFAPDQREAFDMALLRMHAFAPAGSGDVVSASSVPAASAPVASKPVAAKPAAATPANPESPANPEAAKLAVRGAVEAGGASRVTPATPAPKANSSLLKLTPEDWPEIVKELDVSGMPRQLANNCLLESITDSSITLQLEENAEHLNTARFASRLESAVNDWSGQSRKLVIQITATKLDATPARLDAAAQAAELEAARDSIDRDPLVQSLVQQVDGQIDAASIEPKS